VEISDSEGWTDVGCTSDQLLAAAARRGLDGRKWTSWDDMFVALGSGSAVLALCNNRWLIPRSYPPGSGWESLHWVRIVAASDRDDMLYLYDPLSYLHQLDGSVYQGPVASTQQGMGQAIASTAWPEAGVILTSRGGRSLNLATAAP
jgi:hypothetical protein